MRLGSALLSYIKVCKIPYRYRGKYRKVKKPSMHDLLKMKRDFEREEQNMLILRHPYLTTEQSRGHMKEQNGDRNCKFVELMIQYQREKFQKEVTYADRLSHLRVTEAWD
ncbi:PREDICTED: ribosomal protein 63, mitochondrial [Vollenhovia emeryi]|uniref:ribosomal protein 63, mitochondrial n=1 Tax=Vollenhovia emeryi TaxID=411798 RepID=UPI0005F37832|nr:PREDICTED: ribosomal protein 63, mitochondrial [Vollenhovia emeryi]